MSTLSTHVLDTMRGRPAEGVLLRLHGAGMMLFEGRTNEDGRCPALRELHLAAGRYRLEFEIGAYFASTVTDRADPPFLDMVPIPFGLASDTHVHVPLLAAPYAYSTYRGS